MADLPKRFRKQIDDMRSGRSTELDFSYKYRVGEKLYEIPAVVFDLVV